MIEALVPLHEHPYYSGALLAIVAMAVVTFPVLFFISAPYGRHERPGWGPTISARWGWVLMESPAFIGFVTVFALHGSLADRIAWIGAAIYAGHYLYRAFIYPFRMRGGDKPKPLLTCFLGFSVNCCIGPALAYGLTVLWMSPYGQWTPTAYSGLGLVATGALVNHQSDLILRRLRAPGERNYRIPYGGFYQWLSAPNYFGEILQWLGLALFTGAPIAWIFAGFTLANLAPRARSHHRWYQQTFSDYPADRKALIPFLW